jgi:hypothetical protein
MYPNLLQHTTISSTSQNSQFQHATCPGDIQRNRHVKKGWAYRDKASEDSRSDQGQGDEAKDTQSEAQVKEPKK